MVDLIFIDIEISEVCATFWKERKKLPLKNQTLPLLPASHKPMGEHTCKIWPLQVLTCQFPENHKN